MVMYINELQPALAFAFCARDEGRSPPSSEALRRRPRIRVVWVVGDVRDRPVAAKPRRWIYSFRRYASNAARSSAVRNPRSMTRPFDEKTAASWAADLSRRAPEQSLVVVEHLLERRRRVVVKVRSGPADSTELRDVHHAEIRRLPGEKQSAGVRGREGLCRAVRECHAIGPRISVESWRTRRETVGRWTRTGRLNRVIAAD